MVVILGMIELMVIINHDLLGSLTVARAFGDFFLKSSRCSIISSKPDIMMIDRP